MSAVPNIEVMSSSVQREYEGVCGSVCVVRGRGRCEEDINTAAG